MTGRYDQWRKLSGDTERPDLLNEGKKLLGHLAEQRRLSGNKNASAQIKLPDGSVVQARFDGDIPQVRVKASDSSGGSVDSILLYVSSPGGLRLFNLNKKVLARTVVGLAAYEVDGVSQNGKIVYMSGGSINVRVDLPRNAAFGYAYTVNAINPDSSITPATAGIVGSQLSPDGTKLLSAFGFTINPTTSATIDGLGGYLLVNSLTLVPIRPAFRMSFRSQVSCWGPDNKFYMATSLNADAGDVPTAAVADSTADYVSQFSGTGVLLTSRLLYTHASAPGTGFSRAILAMAVHPNNKLLYVFAKRQGDPANTRLHVIDLVDVALPVVATMDLTGTSYYGASISYRGQRLSVLRGTELLEIDTTTLTLVSTNAGFSTTSTFGINQWAMDVVQNGVHSRTGGVADHHRYFFDNTGAIGTLKGYTEFNSPPSYIYNLNALNVSNRYRMANVGATPTREKTK